MAPAMALALGGAGVARAATCDPLTTKPKFDQPGPTAKDILGKQLGKSKLSVDEVYKYVLALDAASPRIVTGVYGTSVRDGRVYLLRPRPVLPRLHRGHQALIWNAIVQPDP